MIFWKNNNFWFEQSDEQVKEASRIAECRTKSSKVAGLRRATPLDTIEESLFRDFYSSGAEQAVAELTGESWNRTCLNSIFPDIPATVKGTADVGINIEVKGTTGESGGLLVRPYNFNATRLYFGVRGPFPIRNSIHEPIGRSFEVFGGLPGTEVQKFPLGNAGHPERRPCWLIREEQVWSVERMLSEVRKYSARAA